MLTSHITLRLLKSLPHQILLLFDSGLRFAFLDFAEQKFHILILAHPPEYVVTQIQQGRVRSQAAAIQLAQLLVRPNSPSANLHFTLIFDLFQGIVLILAPKLPQLLVSVIILKPTARKLKCKLCHVEVQMHVDLL